MRNPDREKVFRFKQFKVANHLSAMKVGTDGVLLGAWAFTASGEGSASSGIFTPRKILDVGCGTGLIALMLAQRFPDAVITGIEIDPTAASEASGNFSNSPWSSRLRLVEGDFATIPTADGDESYDLIVSNPPFFTNGELSPQDNRQIARHEQSLTLKALLSNSRRLLSPQGCLSLILPADREDDLKFQAVANHFHISRLTRVTTVPTKMPRRILAELSPDGHPIPPCHTDGLSIHDEKGGFTEEYSILVKDFYLHF